MSKPYKDRIVKEEDGYPRFNMVDREGNVVLEDVLVVLSSKVLQEGDNFGAKEINTFITRDDDGNIETNFVAREDF